MRKTTSIVLTFIFLNGFMSVFIPGDGSEHACCNEEIICCANKNQMNSCSMSLVEDVSSPTLIASCQKPAKWRDGSFFAQSSFSLFDLYLDYLPVFIKSNCWGNTVPFYTSFQTLLL